MKADVYVELPAAPGVPLKISVRRDGGLKDVESGSFKGNAQTRAVAFAPAVAVSCFRIPVAAKSEAEAKRAALYTLEDEIAQPIEDVHVTLSPRSRNDANRAVFVVDKTLLDEWTNLLRSIGLGHARIVPENSFQPSEPVVYRFEDRWLLAGSDRIVGVDGTLPEEAINALIDAAGLTGAKTVHRRAFDCLSEAYEKDAGTALSSTGRMPEADNNASRLGFWRVAASLALAAVVLWAGSLWIETSRLEQAAKQKHQNAITAFRSQFPGAPEPVDVHADVRRQMERSISSGSGRFRYLASALYKAIADSESVQLARLSYVQDDPRLQARLIFPSRQSEQAFRASLEASGFSVEMVSAADIPQGVEANLAMSARP